MVTDSRVAVLVASLGLMSFGGCGSDDDDGDGTGSGSGNPGSGSGNGAGSGNTSDSGGCFTSTECGTGEICLDGECREMWDRSYSITVVSATAAEGDPNGEYWDAFGGAPDLYVSVRIDGDSIGVTSTKQDTYSPDWYESFNVRLYRTTDLVFRVIDEDVSASDGALDLSVPDLEGAIKNGGGSYSSSGGYGITSLDFTIEPR